MSVGVMVASMDFINIWIDEEKDIKTYIW